MRKTRQKLTKNNGRKPGDPMTLDEIKKVVMSIKKLADLGNPIAVVTYARMENQPSTVQSNEIGSGYIWCYQWMLLFNLALKSNLPSDQYQAELDKLIKKEITNGTRPQ